jgi:hypothetical protein
MDQSMYQDQEGIGYFHKMDFYAKIAALKKSESTLLQKKYAGPLILIWGGWFRF